MSGKTAQAELPPVPDPEPELTAYLETTRTEKTLYFRCKPGSPDRGLAVEVIREDGNVPNPVLGPPTLAKHGIAGDLVPANPIDTPFRDEKEELAEPLHDLFESLGPKELWARLTDPIRQRELEHAHDDTCPECGSGITESSTLGEVGHQRDCPRKKRRYNGTRRGDRE